MKKSRNAIIREMGREVSKLTGDDIMKLEPSDDAARRKLVHGAIRKAQKSPQIQQTGRGILDGTASADKDGQAQEAPEQRIARLNVEKGRLERLLSQAGPDQDSSAMSARLAALNAQIAIEQALQKPKVSMR